MSPTELRAKADELDPPQKFKVGDYVVYPTGDIRRIAGERKDGTLPVFWPSGVEGKCMWDDGELSPWLPKVGEKVWVKALAWGRDDDWQTVYHIEHSEPDGDRFWFTSGRYALLCQLTPAAFAPKEEPSSELTAKIEKFAARLQKAEGMVGGLNSILEVLKNEAKDDLRERLDNLTTRWESDLVQVRAEIDELDQRLEGKP